MALVKAYRCSHSGKYFPADYTKQWGRKYGIGLGIEPVSECLDSNMLHDVAVPANGDIARAMHPMGVTKAQVDFCLVEEEEFNANQLILAKDDPDYRKRAAILRSNQEANSPRLRSIQEEVRKQKSEGVI